MTNREKFQLGDAVKMVPELDGRFPGTKRTGTVAGFSKDGTCIYVNYTGGKPTAKICWHIDYWEKV